MRIVPYHILQVSVNQLGWLSLQEARPSVTLAALVLPGQWVIQTESQHVCNGMGENQHSRGIRRLPWWVLEVLNFFFKHHVYSAFFWQMATLQRTLSTTGQKTRRRSTGWISCSLLSSQLPIISSQQKWWTSNLVTGSVFSSGAVSDFSLHRETSYNRKSFFLSN